MGRISNLWQKIKGMFNKNKALPEGKNVRIEDTTLINNLETKETENLTGHQKFVNQLKEQANEFNPNTMSKEDAIMKILEERGLNKNFAKNQQAKGRISLIVSKMLAQNNIDRITPENLKEVRDIMQYKGLSAESLYNNHAERGGSGTLKITEDGNLVYSEEVRGENNNIDKTTEYFEMNGTDLKTVLNENHKIMLPNGKNDVWRRKSESTFDRNGIEMRRDVAELDNEDGTLDFHKTYSLQRNPDLITANMTVYEDRVNAKQNSKSVDIVLNTEKPEYLNRQAGYTYESLENTEKTMENGIVEHASPMDTPEKQARVSEQNRILAKERENCIRNSDKLAKTAKDQGLIQEGQEMENS